MKKNNTSEIKIWSIDDYLQQKKLSLATLKQKVISGDTFLLLWRDNLRIFTSTPEFKIGKGDRIFTLYNEPFEELVTGYLLAPQVELLPLLEHPIEIDFDVTCTTMTIRQRSYLFYKQRARLYSRSAYTKDFNEAFSITGSLDNIPSQITSFGLQNLLESILERELTASEITCLNLLDPISFTNGAAHTYLKEFQIFRKSILGALESHKVTNYNSNHILSKPLPSYSYQSSMEEDLQTKVSNIEHFYVRKRGEMQSLRSIVETAIKLGYYKVGEYPRATPSQLYVTENIETLLSIKDTSRLSPEITQNEKTIEEAEIEYEDDMIGLASETRDVFWSRYDSSKPETIPTAQDITDWLISEKGVSSQHKASQIEAVARNGRAKPAGRPKKII